MTSRGISNEQIRGLLHRNEVIANKGHRYLDTVDSDFKLMLAAVRAKAKYIHFPDWGEYEITYGVNAWGDETANFQPLGRRIVPCGTYPVKQLYERELLSEVNTINSKVG